MIHQPSGGAQGQATEIQIAAEHILKTRKKLNQILACKYRTAVMRSIAADTERDNCMSAEEAKAYGLIDECNHKPLMNRVIGEMRIWQEEMMMRLRCSFCDKTQDQVRKLIAGSNE